MPTFNIPKKIYPKVWNGEKINNFNMYTTEHGMSMSMKHEKVNGERERECRIENYAWTIHSE